MVENSEFDDTQYDSNWVTGAHCDMNDIYSNASLDFLDCAFTLTQVDGVITSPGFPEKYGLYVDCTWLIQINPGQIIQIEFLNLDIEIDLYYHECL